MCGAFSTRKDRYPGKSGRHGESHRQRETEISDGRGANTATDNNRDDSEKGDANGSDVSHHFSETLYALTQKPTRGVVSEHVAPD